MGILLGSTTLGTVKPFLVYTAMRLALFLATLAIVAGVWKLLSGEDGVPLVWAVVIAFLLSGDASIFLLNRQRDALGARVEQRASRAARKFDHLRASEDD